MKRRNMLSMTAAGTVGAFGFSSGAAGEEFDIDTERETSGSPFNAVLHGTGDPTIYDVSARNRRAMFSTYSGSCQGMIKGSYTGEQIALVFGEGEEGETDGRVVTDEARTRGTLDIVSPDNAVAQNSRYTILFEGWITDCCADDFEFEGEFQSIEATGRFEGTEIWGEISTEDDIGYPMKIELSGYSAEE